jgi:hypothetical protein
VAPRAWFLGGIALVTLLGLSACVAGATTSSKQGTQVDMPECGWPGALNAETLSQHPEFNVSNPDSAAAYWVLPIPVQDGLQIRLSGQYPQSRYMSLAVYDENGTSFTANGVSSSLTDYQIVPDPTNVNPWQQVARPGGAFTVNLQADVTPNQANTLPTAPNASSAGATDVLYLRVYVPANGDASTVPLPTVTVTLNGASKQLPTCPTERQASIAATYCSIPWVAREAPFCQTGNSRPTATPIAASAVSQVTPFANPPIGQGGTPDKDTGYLPAMFIPSQDNQVLVIRAKAPTVPGGWSPKPWPAQGTDLRYWSLCVDQARFPIPVVVNQLPDGTVDYGCRYDDQVTLDTDGYYSYVLGTESQRSAIEAIPGVTFLPLAAPDAIQAYKLNLRNMLSDPAFAEAIQNVPADGRPASAAAVMGPYYPRAAFCSLATLAASGPPACLEGWHLPAASGGGLSDFVQRLFGTR